ncbi:MAG TPA: PilZ domain-containing protein [Candidatus Didemnitutus sp.]|nr:PilZ domain-containing protein [Candidatus Didemnitutus sp.]
MKFFSQLFDIPAEDVPKVERRLQKRYAIGPDFHLAVAVVGDDWNATGNVRDIAVGGLGVTLDRGPAVDTGSNVKVGLRIDGLEVITQGRLRHQRARTPRGLNGGLSLDFDDPKARQAFLQLLIPVSVGASLVTRASRPIEDVEPGVTKSYYAGESAASLSVSSRNKGGVSEAFAFELKIDEYIIRGDRPPNLMFFTRGPMPIASPGDKPSVPTGELGDDVKRLFRWCVLNMTHLPPTEAKYLRRFVE